MTTCPRNERRSRSGPLTSQRSWLARPQTWSRCHGPGRGRAGRRRHQGGSDYLALHPKTRQLPVKRVARRAGFVTNPQLVGLSKLADQARNRLAAVGNNPQAPHFAASLRHRYRNRVRMDIQTHKSYVLHLRLPFVCGSAPRSSPIRSVIHALRIGSRSFHSD